MHVARAPDNKELDPSPPSPRLLRARSCDGASRAQAPRALVGSCAPRPPIALASAAKSIRGPGLGRGLWVPSDAARFAMFDSRGLASGRPACGWPPYRGWRPRTVSSRVGVGMDSKHGRTVG
eukprot:5867104-Pyramimonas_sp.AAC.1